MAECAYQTSLHTCPGPRLLQGLDALATEGPVQVYEQPGDNRTRLSLQGRHPRQLLRQTYLQLIREID
jgi:hypothetical protein